MASGFDGSIKIDTNIDGKGFNSGIKNINKGLGGITSSLKRTAAAIGIAFGINAIVNFGKASIKASIELSNAMTGLQSIMEGQGRSFSKAQSFINSYVSDGLIPATQAITAYKNLALRGYDDTQIQQVLVALKDSAAYGRQASYSLGQAVESATEGLKNENSILVDNAGVTKNVSKMWDDYAKSIGTTSNNLTKQQKIQAEVLGIMEETRFQVGDAAKISDSYSGQILRLGYNFNNLKVAVGNALIPIAQAVLPSINAIIAALTRLANIYAQVATAIFGKQAKQQQQIAKTGLNAAKAQDSLADATKKAGKEAKAALAGFDELNVLTKDAADASSGAVGGLDGNLGISEVTTGGEIGTGVTVSPAVQSAVDLFMEILAPLRSINFDNVSDAFTKLREAIIEAIVPLGKWLVETFLKPIAEWTGGIIVNVLELIAEALTKISDWISENKGLVETIAILVASFAAAWGLVNLAIGIWNGIGFIATGITLAFGAAVAFLTSPIGLVVTAIGLLIAAVVLLVKHWDEVKATAKLVWDEIALIWSKASDWFDKKVLSPIKSGFKQTINYLIGLAEGFANAFIKGINAIIRALNMIDFDIPKWVPIIGGKSFGFNIPSINNVSIPRLATGAVIPPNSEFMAILGDQKSGRNIETPEGLLRQIVKDELSNMQDQKITINFGGNMPSLIRVLKPYIDKENNRVGNKLVIGGAS